VAVMSSGSVSFWVWFPEMITRISDDGRGSCTGPRVSAAKRRHGLDDQRYVGGWICEQPDVLQRIAAQHDHIRMSTAARVSSWPSARSSSAATHVAARSSASVPRCSRPMDTRRPSFLLKPAGLFDRNPTSTCPRRAGTGTQKRHECMARRVDPGKGTRNLRLGGP
jgi:hypothetical protein